MVERPSDLVQSVSRAMRVLEAVGDSPQGCSPKVVTRRTGLHLSTVYHLLRTLAYEGYLVRTDVGDYRLGFEVADRFRDLRASLSHPPRVESVLRALAERTGHSAYLARLLDGCVVISAVAEAAGSPHLEDLVPGFDEAAHATALGKALLATLPTDERRALLASAGLRAFTPATVREVDALEAELSDAGGSPTGVFVEESQFRDGVSCAATLVATGDPAEPWWAVALSASSAALRRRRHSLAAALRVAGMDLAA